MSFIPRFGWAVEESELHVRDFPPEKKLGTGEQSEQPPLLEIKVNG
jgi:hypothetical protein